MVKSEMGDFLDTSAVILDMIYHLLRLKSLATDCDLLHLLV